MPLSSNSIFHFTKEKASLKGILEDNFKIHYRGESVTLGDQRRVFYVPMVSFCDIPLSEIKKHIANYGAYGIGLTKEWAMRNGLIQFFTWKPIHIYQTAIARRSTNTCS